MKHLIASLQGAPPLQSESSKGATLFGWDTGLPGWVVVPVFLIVWTLLAYLFAKLVSRYCKRYSILAGRKIYEIIISSLEFPLVCLFILLGIKVVLDSTAFTDELHKIGYFTLTTLVVLTIVMAFTRILTSILFEVGVTKAAFRPLIGPTRFVVNGLVIVVGSILWMEAVGIPDTPVIAVFGVVGLATGLALMDTMSNLFAGIYLNVERGIRTGDYVRLQTGEEGFVESIGWHSTRIVTNLNNMVVIPNKRLADMVVTNYSMPQATTIGIVEVVVDKDADVGAVKKLLEDQVREAVKTISGAVPEQVPLVRLGSMAPSGLTFQVGVGIQSVLDKHSVESDLRTLMLGCLRKGGIAPWGTAPAKAERGSKDGEREPDREKTRLKKKTDR